jgi:hypothetical protein
MSWSREHAMTVGRSYNYPHVAALHWVLYRLARNHSGLVTNHPWEWYLERAYETSPGNGASARTTRSSARWKDHLRAIMQTCSAKAGRSSGGAGPAR